MIKNLKLKIKIIGHGKMLDEMPGLAGRGRLNHQTCSFKTMLDDNIYQEL